jgi:short-subunit dehydrogenase
MRGCVHVAHAAWSVMAGQGYGHLVNTASGFGLVPGGANMPYVTAKFGVVGMSEALRIEGHDLGIKVSVVCPGFVQTSLLSGLEGVNVRPDVVRSQMPVKAISAERAAREILRGVARNRPIIAFPFYVRVLTVLYRLFPAAAFARSVEMMRRIRARR